MFKTANHMCLRVFFSFVLLLSLTSLAADITISTGGKTTAVETAQVNVVLGKAGTAVFISEDVEYLSKSGEPQIPWKTMTVLLPPNADMTTVSCSAVSAKYEALEGVWDVSAVPPILTRDADGNEIVIWPAGKTIVDGCDTDIYSADTLWPPESVTLAGKGKLRGWRLAEIAVPLMVYNPISGRLQQLIHAEISVDCDKKGKGNANKGRKLGRVKKLAVNFDAAVDLYTVAKGGAKSEPEDAPASDDDIIPLSSTGTSGYVIITTNDIRANSTKLAAFVTHKQNMGFTVTVIDEDDTGATAVGDPAATKLREWLQANYIAMDLKYALIIGDPQPANGYVPMKLYPCDGRDIPTDYFYAELTCDWDSNDNGIIGESGEIERYFEVYVGRIPYYGVMTDTDAILQKTIDYETAADTQWHRNTLISNVPLDTSMHGYNWGEQVKADLLEPDVVSSDRVYRDGYGHTVTDYGILPPPEFPASAYPATVWSQGQYGLHIWSTHGWSGGASGIISSGDTPSLNDNYPSTVWQGSCENAYPYSSDNLSYSILKNGGIVTNGATRNSYYMYETNFSNSPTDAGMGYRYAKGIVEGKSCGEALWDLKEEISSWWNHNWTLFNPYGDPSIVVMGEIPDFQITPTDCFYTQRELGLTDQLESRTYTLLNNSPSSLSWTASKAASWFDVSPASGSIPAGSSVDVVVTLNSGVGDLLTLGVHSDTITFTDTTNNITLLRDVECEIGPADPLKLYLALDEATGTIASDLSVFGNDAGLSGGATFDADSVTGQFGGAIDLDGVDDYLSITGLNIYGNTVTLTAWVKPDGSQVDWAGLFMSRGGSNAGLDMLASNELRYEWNGQWEFSTGLYLPDNQWTFVALVVEPSKATIYMDDGTLQSAVNTTAHSEQTITGAHLGDDYGYRYFKGAIDDARIYNYSMTLAQIEQLIAGGTAESPDPFDEAIGITSELLRWTPGADVVSSDVYIGSSETAVANATTVSAEYKGAVSVPGYLADLNPLTTYYWRVDTITSSTTLTGQVWQFTTGATIEDINASIISHLTMDNADISGATVGDVSGTPIYDGTISGATSGATGQIAEAMTFDGVNDKVTIPTTNLNSNTVSISVWVKRDGLQPDYSGIVIAASGASTTKSGLNFIGGDRIGYHWNGGFWGWNSGLTVPDNQWSHVAITVEPTKATLYVNGVASVSSGTHAADEFDCVFDIGTYDNWSSRMFKGDIDDVAIWNTTLTADQVMGVYFTGLEGRSFGTTAPADTTAPTPDPMTFATAPYATGTTSISMTATMATDASGVEYSFTCTAGGGNNSGWQDSATYEDTGLTPDTQYTYTVTARDKSAAQNTTAASSGASATTDTPVVDTTAPTPNPATFAVAPAAASDTAISMTATTGTDASGPVEYLFTETSGNPGGTSSAWQTSPSYTDTGLTASTQYTYTVTMRDALDNTGTASAPANATTQAAPDTTAPTPDPMTFATTPYATGTTSTSMTATTATDPSGVEYSFACTAGGGNDSGWQDSVTYEDTGLTPDTQYTYTVTARDKSTAQNTTAASAALSATTDPFSGADDTANADIAVQGTVSGSFADTQGSDNVYESIAEIRQGNPVKGFSSLEHKWTVSVTGGTAVSFYVEAYQTASSDNDNFVFAYSTDDSSYTDMLTVSKTSDDSSCQSYALPPTLSGTVYIRVVDTDSTAGATANDTLYIDHMYIHSTGGEPDTDPPAPDPMTWATAPYATGDSSISMTATTATDASAVEYYFTCTEGGGNDSGWQDSTTYEDTGLTPDTSYTYTVTARDKSAGQNTTAASSGASATTDAGCSASTMYIWDIVCDVIRCGGANKNGQVTVTVLDNCGNPVANALVDGTFTGDYSESFVDVLTDANGQAVLTTAGCVKKPSYTFCVDGLTHAALTYSSGDNVETCDSY